LKESSQGWLGSLLGWLIVAVPAAAFLLFAAWITSYKLGVNGGILYAAALLVWAGFLVWRWRRG
jgi:energy-converting hydrogenase Eha subunit B